MKTIKEIFTEAKETAGFKSLKKLIDGGRLLNSNTTLTKRKNVSDPSNKYEFISVYETDSDVKIVIFKGKDDSEITVDYNSDRKDESWSVGNDLTAVENLFKPFIL